ncbi:hypothetical protein [Polaromonas naphthalenivorans]|uniref:Uncharacterized protein n=1 Tax=Polaromonas naphthalenivorans (strain CJ2) TaxID=365044 RepID=A1VQM0_POLNA|nr:hypothetical protein [Polaromonas naphthalenivorans]ABM37948.1 hypothetical protein Pnap_2646 [Polaromonas naphthalenivorans CJ2]
MTDKASEKAKGETQLREDDPRVRAKVKSLRKWITLDAAIDILAMYMVAADIAEKREDEISQIARRLGDTAKIELANAVAALDLALSATKIAKVMAGRVIQSKTKASNRGKAAADALHSKPGNSRDKQEAIRAAWASGKYSSRDLCAEQECAALNMAPGTARRALRNTPEPPRRCTA